MPNKEKIFGIAAEFATEESVLEAAHRVHQNGFTHAEAYTPFPVHGLSAALGFKRSGIPPLVLAGGLFGGLGGFFMLWYANVISYPWNIGGRPTNSWPAWIPITFEMTVLFASFAAFFGQFALSGLPRPYHPMFNLADFRLASHDRFFLCIEATDPKFDLQGTRDFLQSLSPKEVSEVPW